MDSSTCPCLDWKVMAPGSAEEKIAAIYSTLLRAWGRQHWWPAQTRFEVIVGAYLTQNTSWTNVEVALRRLRKAHVLSVDGIRKISLKKLEQLIRSSGYFRQKARKLKTFVRFLDQHYAGSLNKMFAQPTTKLREELLALNGVGPETADSILLYAGQHPVFVVDAYTKRLAARHGILAETAKYEEFRSLFERALGDMNSFDPPVVKTHSYTDIADDTSPADSMKRVGAGVYARPGTFIGIASHQPSRMSLAKRTPLAQVYNEMHGLIVSAGKQYCVKAKGRCEECPLRHLLEPITV